MEHKYKKIVLEKADGTILIFEMNDLIIRFLFCCAKCDGGLSTLYRGERAYDFKCSGCGREIKVTGYFISRLMRFGIENEIVQWEIERLGLKEKADDE